MGKYKDFLNYLETHTDEFVDEIAKFKVKHYDDEYQTDLYCYISDDGKSVQFLDFVNVGGNSYLADDHFCIAKCDVNYNIREELLEFVETPERFKQMFPDCPFKTHDEDGMELNNDEIMLSIVKGYKYNILSEMLSSMQANGVFLDAAVAEVDLLVKDIEFKANNCPYFERE